MYLLECHVGRYLRNADSVGWVFCLARQNGLAITACAKTFILCAVLTSSSVFLAAFVFGAGVFYWLTIHWNRYWPHNPGFVFPPPCPASSFKLSMLYSTDGGLENFRIIEYTKVITQLLSHHQSNVILQ